MFRLKTEIHVVIYQNISQKQIKTKVVKNGVERMCIL